MKSGVGFLGASRRMVMTRGPVGTTNLFGRKLHSTQENIEVYVIYIISVILLH